MCASIWFIGITGTLYFCPISSAILIPTFMQPIIPGPTVTAIASRLLWSKSYITLSIIFGKWTACSSSPFLGFKPISFDSVILEFDDNISP